MSIKRVLYNVKAMEKLYNREKGKQTKLTQAWGWSN